MKSKYLLLLLSLLTVHFSAWGQNPFPLCTGTETWLEAGNTQNIPVSGQRPSLVVHNGNLWNFGWTANGYELWEKNGSTWTYVATMGSTNGMYALYSWGGLLLMGGYCMESQTGVVNTNSLIAWNGSSFQAIGTGLSGGGVFAMQDYMGDLIVAGSFDSAGGLATPNIARWDGSNWTPMGDGFNGSVEDLIIYNGDLYASGWFDSSGVAPVPHLAKWNGTAWVTVIPTLDREISIMEEFNGELYFYGFYINTPFDVVGKYNGSVVSQVPWNSVSGSNLNHFQSYGGNLFATSISFYDAGGVYVENIARFDGAQWHPVSSIPGNLMNDMEVYNNQLYTVTNEDSARSCGNPVGHIAFLCDTNSCGNASGTLYLDTLANCSPDAGELRLVHRLVSDAASGIYTLSDNNGAYHFMGPTGNYTLSPVPGPGVTAICPSPIPSYTVSIAPGSNSSGNDFGYDMPVNYEDLEVYYFPITVVRPGQPCTFALAYHNAGYYPQSGTLTLSYSSAGLSFTSATQSPSLNTPGYLEWNYANLTMDEWRYIQVTFQGDTALVLGDSVCHSATINIPVTEADQPDNFSEGCTEIRASYDPNDKSGPLGYDGQGHLFVSQRDFLYVVRFQNTGNDTAFNIRIQDELDTDLDLSTLQFVGASHDYDVDLMGNRLLMFRFNNILLPDSNVNEPASHGWVAYRIQANANVTPGTVVENTAAIYFDYNAPVITNTWTNTYTNPLSADDPKGKGSSLVVYPNPADEMLNVQSEFTVEEWKLLDLQGRVVKAGMAHAKQFEIGLGELPSGLYLVQAFTENGVALKKVTVR